MQIANINQTTTMSSRDIAELTGKEHGHVMRDIRTMLGYLDGQSSFGGTYLDAQGKERPCFNLPYDETICLLTGYDPKARLAVIKRWKELESKQTQVVTLPDFNNPAVAARAWAEQYEAKTIALEVVEKQKIQLESQAYSVAYVDNFVKAEGLIGIREAGKVFGINQNALVNMLIGANVLFRENGHLQAYAQDIAAGRFVAKVELDANGKARPSTKFTSKGLRWVAGKLKLDQLFND